jgi:hypothetical protein
MSTAKSLSLTVTTCLVLAASPPAARAQDPSAPPAIAATPGSSAPAAPAAPAGARTVGWHVGAAVPVVSFHSVGKGTQTPSDQLTIAVPIGISVHLSETWLFDFETVVANDVNPWGGTGLTVDPGVIYVGAPVALGLRAKFDVGAAANFGLIPLVHKGIVDVGYANWFVEAAFPMTAMRGNGYTLAAVAHTGFAF